MKFLENRRGFALNIIRISHEIHVSGNERHLPSCNFCRLTDCRKVRFNGGENLYIFQLIFWVL